MTLAIVAQAALLFAVTNIDDIVVLALFFAQGAGRPGSTLRIVVGQYLGFGAILVIALVGAFGTTFLPEQALPYLGSIPLLLGIRAGWQAWRERRDGAVAEVEGPSPGAGPTITAVTTVTFANGGDNIGVYIPVFATTEVAGVAVFSLIFLLLLGVWCAAGYFITSRPVVARFLGRWGHVLMPVVLIGIGSWILVEGGAFGL